MRDDQHAKVVKIVDDGQGARRESGNASFPAPTHSDVGRVVVIDRACDTWDGYLARFEGDGSGQRYAFWVDELEMIR